MRLILLRPFCGNALGDIIDVGVGVATELLRRKVAEIVPDPEARPEEENEPEDKTIETPPKDKSMGPRRKRKVKRKHQQWQTNST